MMAKADPALQLRVPAAARRLSAERQSRERGAEDRPRLRLVVTKGRLGVELEEGIEAGPLTVSELSLSLPDVKFPVELSGGVGAFRNRRGQLERVVLEAPAQPLSSWGAPRLKGSLGEGTPRLVVAPLEDGWLIGLSLARRALAFEVLLAPLDGDLRFVPTAARGAGLNAPPQALAIRVLESLLRPAGQVVGGALVVEDAASVVARHVLPLAGMRAPASAGVRWNAPDLEIGLVRVCGMTGAPPAASSERVIRAVELAALVAPAEAELVRGNLDAARRLYLGALEQAPRHLELTRRVAELDACVGGRAEAALGTLTDAVLAVDGGLLGGRLLAQVGDVDGARAALRRAASQEAFGPLAAMAWLELAALWPAPSQRGEALDEAVRRAPSLELARWRRLEGRIRSGDMRGVRDDGAHLEQQAHGSIERHAVVRRVASALLDHGLVEPAAEWFERALRYMPDSIDAVAGLARALQQVGRRRRALDLLSRAAALSERAGRPAHGVALDLATALVEVADDRPAAIAHARSVPPLVAEAFEARLLEARWRTELGDLAGAAVALGRLADAVEQAYGVLLQEDGSAPAGQAPVWGDSAPWATRADARAAIAALLTEGAQIQELDRQDLPAAQRMLELAMRLSPRNQQARRRFRRVCEALRGAADQAVGVTRSPAAEPAAGPAVSGERTEATTERPPPTIASSPGSALGAGQAAVSEAPDALTDAPPPDVGDSSRADDLAALGEVTAAGDEDSDPASGPFVLLDTPSSGVGEFELDPDSSGGDELLIAELTDKLRADPSNVETVQHLVVVLEQARRDHDLLALLSARIDEGPEALRAELLVKRREVLERLLDGARKTGNESEAELYALMLERSS